MKIIKEKNYEEWVRYFSMFVDKDIAKKLSRKVVEQGYVVEEVENDDVFNIFDGWQYFGSGGYIAGYKIWKPKDAWKCDLEAIVEIVDEYTEDNGFVVREIYTCKPRNIPFVISTSETDGIGGGRVFARSIIIYG